MKKGVPDLFLPNKLRRKLQKKMSVLELQKSVADVFRIILIISLVPAAAFIVYLNILDFMSFYQLSYRIILSISLLMVAYLVCYAASWIVFAVYLDLRMYSRTRAIETNLPDYLEFTAANLRAGMPIDKALWLAIRPKFGALAIEMEKVAKDTMSGSELSAALIKFADKYESPLLKRAVSLLIEGLEAGGRISELISKIAWNLDEISIIKKEISASVLNYVIFIGFATVIAAPLLFSLCSMLITIVSGFSNLIPTGAATGMQTIPLGFSQSGISDRDFKIYAYLSLSITSVFSAMIISIIRKGRIKDGIKIIPVLLFLTILLFTVASRLLHALFGGIM
jgi:pilus assembly protein TadC